MNRRITIIVAGLLAIGALEFALLGADAAGLTDRTDNAPPAVERGIVQETPTSVPFVTVTPTLTGLAISVEANPAAVDCVSAQSTVLTATVTSSGQSVPDGTPVTFVPVALATADPINTTTADGIASSTITPLSNTTSGVSVVVAAGDAQTGTVEHGTRQHPAHPGSHHHPL
jgi:hypothetical protein